MIKDYIFPIRKFGRKTAYTHKKIMPFYVFASRKHMPKKAIFHVEHSCFSWFKIIQVNPSNVKKEEKKISIDISQKQSYISFIEHVQLNFWFCSW